MKFSFSIEVVRNLDMYVCMCMYVCIIHYNEFDSRKTGISELSVQQISGQYSVFSVD